MGRIIGLTGGIACGKSAAADVLRQLGVPVVDADQIARSVVEPGTPALKAIHQHFGDRVLSADGSLDRAALAATVFEDPDARKTLESITHPEIIRASLAALQRQLAAGHPAAVYEAALLVETERYRELDGLMVVYAAPETQLRRLTARDGLSLEQARARIDSQLSIEAKLAVATVSIENNGSLAQLEEATRRAWTELRSHAA